MKRAEVIGTGSYLPEGRLTNADLERLVDTNDKWIVERTGIRERRILTDDSLATSDMAAAAARRALDAAALQPDDLDAIILGTVTPDMTCPAAAVRVQQKLGATRALSFDVSAACAGSLVALDVATGLLENGRVRHALVLGAEAMSRIVNYEDRNTCVIFGDAAGAMVLRAQDGGERGVLGVTAHTDGRHWELIHVPGGGSVSPGKRQPQDPNAFTIHMAGREVFKFAVRALHEVAIEILERHGFSATDVDWVVAHQANLRIIDALAQRLTIPRDRFVLNIDRTGNTSSASVPVALDEAVRDGRVQPGQLLLLLAIGAGMTWAAALVRW